jgi:hypothetical protein
MDREATIDVQNTNSSPSQRIKEGLTRSARNAGTLLRLQWDLLATDLQESARRLVIGLVLLSVGFLLAVAALPVALVGFGLWLASALELSTSAGFLWIAGGTLLVSLCLIVAAWAIARAPFAVLQRSSNELQKNMSCIKSLVSDGDVSEVSIESK